MIPGQWIAEENGGRWYCTHFAASLILPSFFCAGGRAMAEKCAVALNAIFMEYGV